MEIFSKKSIGRIYKEKPPEGKISKKIKTLPPGEIARIKAAEINKEVSAMNKSMFDKENNVEIEILFHEYKDGIFSCVVEVKKDGKIVKVNNPFNFYNPPLKVHDGTFRKEGNIDVQNFVESPADAIREILFQAILPKIK